MTNKAPIMITIMHATAINETRITTRLLVFDKLVAAAFDVEVRLGTMFIDCIALFTGACSATTLLLVLFELNELFNIREEEVVEFEFSSAI